MDSYEDKIDDFKGQKMFVLSIDIHQQLIRDSISKLLYVKDIGYFPKAACHAIHREKGISDYILLFCVGGCGTVTVGNSEFVLTTNDYCLIRKNEAHHYIASENNPWTLYWVHFDGEKAEDICKDIPTSAKVLTKDNDHLGRTGLFNNFFELLGQGITLDKIRFISMQFWSLLSSFAYADMYASLPKTPGVIDKAINYMTDHLYGSLSLEDVANQCSVSQSQLSNIFKKDTGYSPINYFILLKMQEASRLLSFSDCSVKEVAFRLGYDDQYYFSRIFKKIVGSSPKQYRQRNC